MQNKLIMLMVLLPNICFSVDNDLLHEEMVKQQMKDLAKQGVVMPGSGVNLVSENELNIPKWAKQKMVANLKQKEKLGYVKEDIPRAKELLNYKEQALQEAKISTAIIQNWSTVLRSKVEDLKMAYTFIGVQSADITHFTGIAPVGKYTNDGWSGAIEYFDTHFASCAYTEKNLRITGGSSRINKDIVTDTVNGKITLMDVRGTEASGYLYQTTWFDENFEHTLECANKNYLTDINTYLIELAKRIDSN